ncbi:MAG TPA: hypothetical protein PKK94_29185, partial [Leptospiraceae bacterium]|nr:hypothetical protein [Leptospiraceae bacterium]
NCRVKFLKLSEKEKLCIKSLSVISKIPQIQIREVFISLLYLLAAEIKSGRDEISIPFFGDFRLSSQKSGDDVTETVSVKLNSIIKTMLRDILEGRETAVQRHVKKDIAKFIAESLDFTEQEFLELLREPD